MANPREKAKKVIEEYTKSPLHQLKSTNEEVQRIAMPFLETDPNVNQSEAHESKDQMHNVTVRQAAEIAVNGLSGKTAPASSKWQSIKAPPGSTEAQIKALEEASDRCHDDISAASNNFLEAYNQNLEQFIHFGVMNMSTLRGKRRRFNFQAIPTGSYVYLVDSEGFADTVLYKFLWTVQECVSFFGLESIKQQPKIKQAYDKEELGQRFGVIHKISRRLEFSELALEPDPTKREYQSEWVSIEDEAHIAMQDEVLGLIPIDGLYDNPYIIERFKIRPGNTSALGVTNSILPLIRGLNNFSMSKSKAANLAVSPPWTEASDSESMVHQRIPDGTILVDPAFDFRPGPVPFPNIADIVKMELGEQEQLLKNFYWNNFFQLFTNQDIATTPKTAFESQMIKAEQLQQLTTISSRIVKFLSQVVRNVFRDKLRSGDFDDIREDFPRSLDYEIISPLAKALESQAFTDLLNALEISANFAGVYPGMKHVVDAEQAFRESLIVATSIPIRHIRSSKEVQEKQQEENDMLKARQMMETANLAADAQSKLNS